MRLFSLVMVFYIIISVIVGALLVGFSLHLFELGEITTFINQAYFDYHSRITLGATGVVLVLIALLFAQATSDRHEREKTIAFNNPSGQVTITLYAVEDLIRKIGHEMPQIKEMRPDVVATKKRGLQVRIRLILRTATNIPEFTAHLQELVRTRMQETLGIEDQITVKIHIAKILSQQEKTRKNKEETDSSVQEDIQVPFPRR